jgi:activator of HSP90 ATPase
MSGLFFIVENGIRVQGDKMDTKTLHQTVLLAATPHDVYEALMDSKQHSAFTGDVAKISRRIDGPFSAFNGYATGMNLELVQDKKIVQKWRASDWPITHYSVVTFEFTPVEKGTEIKFTQTDIPEEAFDEIKQGWIDWYWARLKQYFK